MDLVVREYRWTIQVVVLVFWLVMLYYARLVYIARFEWRYCLRHLIPWMAHGILWYIVVLVNTCVGPTEISTILIWWASVIKLHAAFAFIRVFHYILKNGY